jgi:transcription elongation factor Elf1
MTKSSEQNKNQVATKSRCPSCGHEIQSTLEEVKMKPQFACPSCGDDCDVREAVAWLELHISQSWLKRVA